MIVNDEERIMKAIDEAIGLEWFDGDYDSIEVEEILNSPYFKDLSKQIKDLNKSIIKHYMRYSNGIN